MITSWTFIILLQCFLRWRRMMIGCDTVSAQGQLFHSQSVYLSHHNLFFCYCGHKVCVELFVWQSVWFSLSLSAYIWPLTADYSISGHLTYTIYYTVTISWLAVIQIQVIPVIFSQLCKITRVSSYTSHKTVTYMDAQWSLRNGDKFSKVNVFFEHCSCDKLNCLLFIVVSYTVFIIDFWLTNC